MKFAPLPPGDLSRVQEWFSHAVSRTLLSDGSTPTPGVESADLGRQAQTRIRARNGVDGFARLTLYNRQYWFRLIDCMQEDYPRTLRLLGLDAFNVWAARYLNAHPSDSPYLADLGRRFCAFLEVEYPSSDRDFVLEAALYDSAFNKAFDSPEGSPLQLEGLEKMCLQLAPHATPLWLRQDLSSPTGQTEDSLRPVLREHGVLIYRRGQTLYEKEISRGAYLLLKSLEHPRTLAELFESLESTTPPEVLAEVEKNLTEWFRDWVELGWVCESPLRRTAVTAPH